MKFVTGALSKVVYVHWGSFFTSQNMMVRKKDVMLLDFLSKSREQRKRWKLDLAVRQECSTEQHRWILIVIVQKSSRCKPQGFNTFFPLTLDIGPCCTKKKWALMQKLQSIYISHLSSWVFEPLKKSKQPYCPSWKEILSGVAAPLLHSPVWAHPVLPHVADKA